MRTIQKDSLFIIETSSSFAALSAESIESFKIDFAASQPRLTLKTWTGEFEIAGDMTEIVLLQTRLLDHLQKLTDLRNGEREMFNTIRRRQIAPIKNATKNDPTKAQNIDPA